jgi:hypothetical protein
VTTTAIRAVVLHQGRVVATASADLDPDRTLRSQLGDLFDRHAALARRASVRLALERPAAQAKAILDAPPGAKPELLERAIRENSDRYFIGGSGDHYVGVRVVSDRALIAAFQRSLVDEVAAAALAAGARDVVSYAASTLSPVTTETLGPEFAVALGATVAAVRELPAVRIAAPRRLLTRKSGAVASAAILILLLAAPVIHDRMVAAAAERALGEIRGASTAAMGVGSRLGELRRNIDRVTPMTSPSMTSLLSQLTDALPADASLLALTVDTARGSAVLLAANAVEALPALDSIRLIESVRLSGPVTRDRIADRDLERATILFTMRAMP